MAAGEMAAVVNGATADASGICQTPRPNVPAARTWGEVEGGAALNATTGALGSPAPKTDQQTGAVAHEITSWVMNTPASVPTYAVLASCGSMTRLLAADGWRLD